ncbi:unnamed protein product [Somion occarium]|uniref:DNA-directed RNA polymerase III subunit RPC9 n=2 Tax=Somion occarium TaxID=3059160 RepID=A0ABP1E0I1_9APHY
MEVVNQRSALLSNYEVLTLLKELESDHLARTRTALRIKKEEEAAGLPRNHVPQEEVLENLRTIEVEAIQYLSADHQPSLKQTDASISQLTRSLSRFDLTKAEKLQIVNLAPTEAVELYVIVEELEDRLGDHMQDILSTVRASLIEAVSSAEPTHAPAEVGFYQEPVQAVYQEAETWEYDANEIVFEDNGEGAGVEGDLDIDED